MEEDTPKFCHIENNPHNQSAFSFSFVYDDNAAHSKPNSRHSTLSKPKKHRKSKTKTKSKFVNLNISKDKINIHSEKINIKNFHIFNIEEFLNKHKFKLNNNFDRKNSKKFLNSKEEAFKMPFF